jgi:hypothetical protein
MGEINPSPGLVMPFVQCRIGNGDRQISGMGLEMAGRSTWMWQQHRAW